MPAMSLGIVSATVCVCACVSAVRCWPAVDTLLWPEEERTTQRWLPYNRLAQVRDREREHTAAWHTLRVAALWVVLVVGLAHIYSARHDTLMAERDAARIQQPPFHCGDNGRDWPDLTWSESMYHTAAMTFYPTSAEKSCAAYLDRVNRDVWPNPLFVLVDVVVLVPMRWVDGVADGVGAAIEHFLSHFAWLMQLSVLLGGGAFCVAAVLAWPYLSACRRFGHALNAHYAKPGSTQEGPPSYDPDTTYQHINDMFAADKKATTKQASS